MPTALRYVKRIAVYLIHHPMFVANSARPKTLQIMLEGFGFTIRALGVALNVFDEQVQALKLLPEVLLPPKIIFLSVFVKRQSHLRLNKRSIFELATLLNVIDRV
jgi:hypothetical protein